MSEDKQIPDYLLAWSPLQKAIPTSLPSPPAPEITPSSLLNSLQAFDAIVQKVVEINAGRWIFPEDAPILVRAVLNAITEVNNERNEKQNHR